MSYGAGYPIVEGKLARVHSREGEAAAYRRALWITKIHRTPMLRPRELKDDGEGLSVLQR